MGTAMVYDSVDRRADNLVYLCNEDWDVDGCGLVVGGRAGGREAVQARYVAHDVMRNVQRIFVVG